MAAVRWRIPHVDTPIPTTSSIVAALCSVRCSARSLPLLPLCLANMHVWEMSIVHVCSSFAPRTGMRFSLEQVAFSASVHGSVRTACIYWQIAPRQTLWLQEDMTSESKRKQESSIAETMQ
eukprot:1979331-Amphidinium_carterae.1